MAHDLRYAIRRLRRSPGFAAAAIVTLALGIGANTTIYSVLQAVWIDAVPFRDPGRLVILSSLFERGPRPVSDDDYEDWRRENAVFEEMGAAGGRAALLQLPGNPATLYAQRVSASLFGVLGARMSFGRSLAEEDEHPNAPFVVVISHRFWQRHFGGDRNVLGRTLPFTPAPATIVGIAPPDFRLSRAEPIGWVPRRPLEARRSRGSRDLIVVARLKPGVSISQAREAMNVISARLAATYPDTNRGNPKTQLEPLRDRLIGAGVGDSLFLLFGATALVLLIACANAANLFLARATDRRKELAVRFALGAGRSRVLRQILVESAIVTIAGAVVGLGAMFAARDALVASMPYSVPRTDAIGIDARVLLFTLAAAIATTILAGLLPAIRAAGTAPLTVLADSSAASTGATRRRIAQGLICAEVALALIVLATAALLVGSFVRLVNTDPGFDPGGVLVIQANPPENSGQAVFEQVVAQLAATPGVRSVGGIETFPLSGGRVSYAVRLPGRAATEDPPQIDVRRVIPGYFQAMGIPIKAGRDFTSDDRKGTPWVAIVNEAAARTFWPSEAAVGQRIQSTQRQPAEVIAVVGDVHHQGLDSAPVAEIYVSIYQEGIASPAYVVRTDGDPRASAVALQAAVERVPGMRVAAAPQTMDEHIVRSVHVPRFRALLFGLLGVLVVVLTALGVFSVTGHSVVQRRREMGIRIALGAGPHRVVRLVVGQALAPVVVGAMIGLAGALGTTRLIAHFLFRTTPSDPLTLASAVVLVFAAAVLAAYFPARRAMRVDPIVALRTD
jgi:putative ABC transport system permease protein